MRSLAFRLAARVLLPAATTSGVGVGLHPGTAAGASPVPQFRAVTVDPAIAIGYGVAVADVDGDRRPDLVLADKNVIAWYRNPDWTRFVVAERLTELDHVCVAAADVDGDGKAEIAAGAGWNPGDTIGSGALFYLKAPADRTQRWEPVRLAHDPTIHRIRWVKNPDGKFDLVSVPLHGRGNKNGAGDGVRVLAYRVPPEPATGAWTSTLLADAWHATHNFDSFPLPRGPAEELLLAAREGVFSLVPSAGGWRVETIATHGPAMPEFVGAGEVRAGRIGRRLGFVTTLEPMHGNQLAVYRPRQAAEPDGPWHRTVIDSDLIDGHALACGDLLGTGTDQIVAGWRAMNRPGARVGIRLYVAEDLAQGRWTAHPIDDNQMACEDLQLADFDADGDLDIVASGRATRNLKVYFNETRPPLPR
jgi:hypothetical protein